MIQVSKSDIRKALGSPTIAEMPPPDVKVLILLCLREFTNYCGLKSELESVEEYTNLFMRDLAKHYGHIPSLEVKLALEYGASGVFGDKFIPKFAVSSFFGYLNSYLTLNERKIAKAEHDQERQMLAIEQKNKPTEEQVREMMAHAWKLVCEAEDKGLLYNDPGNTLFEYMEKLGKIKLEDWDIEDALEYHKHHAAQPEGLGIQREMSKDALKAYKNNDKRYILPMAKKFALRRIRREQLMEIEARKIKAKQA